MFEISLQSLYDDVCRWNAGPVAFTETDNSKDDADYDSDNAYITYAVFFHTIDLI